MAAVKPVSQRVKVSFRTSEENRRVLKAEASLRGMSLEQFLAGLACKEAEALKPRFPQLGR